MSELPPPIFVENDPEALTRSLIQNFEELSGRTLQPAQVERILIDLISYEGSLQRAAIQDAAQQNLVRFARAPMLDYLGEMVGITRLEPQPARTKLRFELDTVQGQDFVVPQGTVADAKSGQIRFESDEPLTIPAGSLWGEVFATAREVGDGANGFLPGEVTSTAPIGGVRFASNVTVTSGGSDMEDDERLRTRIKLAPNAFSVAGPSGSYRSFILGAHPDIVDVAVLGPEFHNVPGRVDIYILAEDGQPSTELIDSALDAVNDDKVRPITDDVQVLSPTQIDVSLSVTITILEGTDQNRIVSEIETKIQELGTRWRTTLGADIVDSQIIAEASTVRGVHRVTLDTPVDMTLTRTEFGNLTDVTINVSGVENG